MSSHTIAWLSLHLPRVGLCRSSIVATMAAPIFTVDGFMGGGGFVLGRGWHHRCSQLMGRCHHHTITSSPPPSSTPTRPLSRVCSRQHATTVTQPPPHLKHTTTTASLRRCHHRTITSLPSPACHHRHTTTTTPHTHHNHSITSKVPPPHSHEFAVASMPPPISMCRHHHVRSNFLLSQVFPPSPDAKPGRTFFDAAKSLPRLFNTKASEC
jgi:hypothetical protein